MPHFLPQVVAMAVTGAVIAYVLRQKLKSQPIVGFLLAGVAIGPNALGLVDDPELIEAIAEIGIVLLLFTLGIELSLERLGRLKRAIFAGGGLQLLLAIGAVTGLLAILRGGETIGRRPRTSRCAGDRVTARGSAQAFAAAALQLRSSLAGRDAGPPVRTIALAAAQRTACAHGAGAREELRSTATGCEDCLKLGETDGVHLRMCLTCGGMRCCDSSKNRHATRHHEATSHPIIRSYQPGEEWAWCYPDARML